jgi:hypothetical protein
MTDPFELRAAEVELWRSLNALRSLDGKPPLPVPAGGDAEPPLCGFCGKGKNQVKSMIAGASAHICGNCVVVCAEIIEAGVLDLP